MGGEVAAGFRLRDYQREWIENVDRDRANGFTRLLIDASGGLGKSTAFAAIAKQEWERHGKRTLVLANRDRLVRQSADRMRKETGLEVDIEMADMHASPFSPIVMASIQTLSKVSRLTGFSDDHFSVVVPDEAHRSLSDQFQRVLKYFHYGSESLEEGWVTPKDGEYIPKATIIGTTATPPAVGKKNHLGQFFQKFSARYSYLKSVDNGWLVPSIMISKPVDVDLKKLRIGRTSHGKDFNDGDMSAMIIPVVDKLVEQIVIEAPRRKTMAFWPSVECAQRGHESTLRQGLDSIFVSGECVDADDRATTFDNAPTGTVLNLCSIYVEGIDFPSVNAIAWYRATLSEEFYKQGIFRGTRVLPGVVNDDMTAEERKAAIASSDKPDLLIFDPFYRSDFLDLCSIHDLYTDNHEVAKMMRSMNLPLVEAAKKAERDFIAALEKEAKKHKNKLARTIDPLSFAVAIHDDKLASFVPQEPWEALPPSEAQLKLLQDLGWQDPSKIKTAGLAQKMTSVLLLRKDHNLASPSQLNFLTKLGCHDAQMPTWSKGKAGIEIMLRKRRY